MIRVLLFSFVLLIVSGCNNDYAHKLPNGYSLTHAYSGCLSINDAKHVVIVGPSKYGLVIGVKAKYIVGNLDTEEKAFGVDEIPDKYFIVDTSTGVAITNLSLPEYSSKLKEFNLGEVPLKRPSKLGYK